jgi:hypothetical protein
MRSDFVLPAVLAVALALMARFAASGDESASAAAPGSSPIQCQVTRIGALSSVPEASGLASSRVTPQLFWTHNDSTEPIVHAVGVDGRVRGRVRIMGASVTDWEAIATAPCNAGSCLFIGDIGDNDGARSSVVIFRIPEPTPEQGSSAEATIIEGMYPEGPQDAEAMFVRDGALFVVTKGEEAPIRLYRFPTLTDRGPHRLHLVATLTEQAADKIARITDAAVSPDDRWVALRTNAQVYFYDADALLAGRPGTPYSVDIRAL